MPPTEMRPEVGSSRPEQQRRDRALAGAALADQRHRLARRELQVQPVEHGLRARRIGEGDPLEPDGARAGLGASRAPAAGTAGASSSANIRSATASPSALAWYSAPRRRNGRYSSGASTMHGQPGLEAEDAADEPHAGRDRDERDPERRRELQHGARQEADAQRLHGRRAIALADLGQRGHLVVRPGRTRAASAGPARRRESGSRAAAAPASARAFAARCSGRSAT